MKKFLLLVLGIQTWVFAQYNGLYSTILVGFDQFYLTTQDKASKIRNPMLNSIYADIGYRFESGYKLEAFTGYSAGKMAKRGSFSGEWLPNMNPEFYNQPRSGATTIVSDLALKGGYNLLT
ncbi:hypothetical protein CCZ01_09290 [Helicobacter monodelphidis]|uniref:hypothetical protein n=1 Tax=Helicobacter sp. 15-1451 TaxID=2004995 RepID=UPI000DCB30D6|nr:hypothetical protein [Helicobacter sp. 15-1451]RAX56507.1 hypothetical protein CCZ01_09290 [Helicobacter sp. 15-1451]